MAVVALVGVAVAWGISFVVVKDVGASMPAAALVSWRFGIASVALVLVRPRTIYAITGSILRSGGALGCLLGAGFLLCTYGMRTTPVVSSAFIVGTTVVFTPVVALFWFRRVVGPRIVISTLLATLGLALLTLRGTAVGVGGLLILFAAVIWAVHLCALERWVRPDQVYASALVQVTTAAVTAFAVGWLSGDHVRLPEAGEGVGLIYLGAVATAAAFVALTWAQTRTDATTAAVLLTLEPVVGGAAAVALGEPLMLITALGAAVVIGASGLATWRGRTVTGV
jgi:drug/metabolite transporter (DMT)-like permease